MIEYKKKELIAVVPFGRVIKMRHIKIQKGLYFRSLSKGTKDLVGGSLLIMLIIILNYCKIICPSLSRLVLR